MISIYQIKPAFQRLLQGPLHMLHKLGITANTLTITAIFLSFGLGIGLWYAPQAPFLFAIIPVGLLLRMALNALDGMMARRFQQQSKKGEILNEMGDILSDIFIFLPLLQFPGTHALTAMAFVIAGITNETSGILAKNINGVRRYDGPMGKSDRAFLLGILCMPQVFHVDLTAVINPILLGAVALMLVSTFIRLKKSLQ